MGNARLFSPQVSGEADLTGVVLSITTERSEVVSYRSFLFQSGPYKTYRTACNSLICHVYMV